MGACTSQPETSSSQPPPHQPPRQAPRQQQQQRQRRGDAEQIESLVRVGSRVLKESTTITQTSHHHHARLKAARASSYDHVHKVVLTNFESRDVVKGRAGVVGLTNLGNTCFLNSSLQCLSNTIPMTDYFLGYDYRKEINYDNVLGTKGELATAYTALMKQLWLGRRAKVTPSAFVKRLGKFAPQFQGGQQHDAQELLAFLLDGIHEDLNRVKDRPYILDKDCDGTNDEGDAVLAWQNYLLRNRSIVVDLFQGQLRNTMTCRNRQARSGKIAGCGHKNIKFEPFMYLSLPLTRDASCYTLDDCLDLYCAEERLTGDNQWYCPSCKKHVDATKKLDLWMLPPILIVHLKRFDYSGHKMETPIFYPVQDWDLSRAVKSNGGLYPLFDLYAVSNHRGDLGGGHYTAFVKNRFNETWWEMNDSSTRRLDSSELESNPEAYCLFYNRVERKAANAKHRKRSDPKVMRQSADRPELWPHMQLTTEFKAFQRSTKVKDLPMIAEA